MPHIRVEFDALQKMDLVDHGAGLTLGTTHRGLMLVWLGVVRSKKPTVNKRALRGYFPGADDGVLSGLLCEFGFLELLGPDEYRIKGADRLLKELRAKSEGGKAAAGNLKKGKSAGREPGSSPAGAGREPEDVSGSSPATPKHPNTHTALKEEDPAGTKPPAPAPQATLFSDPVRAMDSTPVAVDAHPERRSEWRKATDELSRVFLEETSNPYKFQKDKDPPALKGLMSYGLPEMLARWRRGLRNAKTGAYPGVTSIAQLGSKWNDLAVAPAKRGRAEVSDWDKPREVDEEGNLVIRM